MANSTSTVYTITNNHPTNNATIRYLWVSGDHLSQIQHHIDFSNGEMGSYLAPYADFTWTFAPLISETIWEGDISPVNQVYLGHSSRTLYLESTTGIQVGYTISGNGFTSNQTVTNVTNFGYIITSSPPNTTARYREAVTFSPPKNYVRVSSTANISIGNIIWGKGFYFPQEVLGFSGTNYIELTYPPSTYPEPNEKILFSSVTSQLVVIAPTESKTFSLYYSNQTATRGTYSHFIHFVGTVTKLPGTQILENEIIALTNFVSVVPSGQQSNFDDVILPVNTGTVSPPTSSGTEGGGGTSGGYAPGEYRDLYGTVNWN